MSSPSDITAANSVAASDASVPSVTVAVTAVAAAVAATALTARSAAKVTKALTYSLYIKFTLSCGTFIAGFYCIKKGS